MEKINYKNKRSKWQNKSRLCAITCIGLITFFISQCFYKKNEVLELENAVVLDSQKKIKDLSEFQVPDLLSDSNIACLVQNGYFEARNQDDQSVISVIMVVLNRAKDERYPNSICDVIHQGYTDEKGKMILNRCQFSWYCDGKVDSMYNFTAMKRVEGLVYKSLWLWYNDVDITSGSTHYHSKKVNPSWSSSLYYTTDIGDHKFYRWNKTKS